MGSPLCVTASPAIVGMDPGSCLCGDQAGRPWEMRPGVQVVWCKTCGLLVRHPRPEPETLLKFYREEYWARFADEQAGAGRHNLFREALDWIERIVSPPGTLVDVGCGMGALIAASQSRGWRATGIDPSPEAVAQARARGLEVFEGAWPPSPLPAGIADVVTFVNVLDHLADPLAALRESHRVLKPGGCLYVRVPNSPIHARLTKFLSKVGLGRLPVFHVFGFGASAFRYHLPNAGFVVERIRTAPPSQADAYHRSTGEFSALRSSLKRLDRAAYRLSCALRLDERAWGLSIEVLARKQESQKAAA